MISSTKKQANSSTVETVESIETFDKRGENYRVRLQKVSTVKFSNIETIESRSKVSTVSMKPQITVETLCSEKHFLNIFSLEFQRFQQFQRGVVGGVSQ